MRFGIDDSNGTSQRCVSAASSFVVSFFACEQVRGVTNVERSVRAAQQINPNHPDDDGIVSNGFAIVQALRLALRARSGQALRLAHRVAQGRPFDSRFALKSSSGEEEEKERRL